MRQGGGSVHAGNHAGCGTWGLCLASMAAGGAAPSVPAGGFDPLFVYRGHARRGQGTVLGIYFPKEKTSPPPFIALTNYSPSAQLPGGSGSARHGGGSARPWLVGASGYALAAPAGPCWLPGRRGGTAVPSMPAQPHWRAEAGYREQARVGARWSVDLTTTVR
jgi:hypothetical protein